MVAAPAVTGRTAFSNEDAARMRAGLSFKFTHPLAHDPALTLDSVIAIAERLLTAERYDQVFYRGPNSGGKIRYATRETRDDAIASLNGLEAGESWIRLTRIDDADPRVAGIVEACYADLSALYGRDVKAETFKTFATLFVSGPNAVTHYHFDHTWNFLHQIRGSKTVYLFDPDDPRVITQADKEAWYVQRPTPIAKDDAYGRAFAIAPGEGVHHPVNAPHWVQNGPAVSISLSLGLALHRSNRAAKIHQANYLLRRAGLRPAAPGASVWRDAVKAGAIDLFSVRNPTSFDDVVFSGINRIKRTLKPRRSGAEVRPAYQE